MCIVIAACKNTFLLWFKLYMEQTCTCVVVNVLAPKRAKGGRLKENEGLLGRRAGGQRGHRKSHRVRFIYLFTFSLQNFGCILLALAQSLVGLAPPTLHI